MLSEILIMAREGKAPAFQWYGRDFLATVFGCDLDAIGAIALLRCLQWEHGPHAGDEKTLCRDLRCTKAKLAAMMPTILRVFTQNEDGSLVDLDMETQRKGNAEYRELQSAKGKASAESKRLKRQKTEAAAAQTRLQPDANQPPPPVVTEPATAAAPGANSAICDPRSAVEEENTHPAGATARETPPVPPATAASPDPPPAEAPPAPAMATAADFAAAWSRAFKIEVDEKSDPALAAAWGKVSGTARARRLDTAAFAEQLFPAFRELGATWTNGAVWAPSLALFFKHFAGVVAWIDGTRPKPKPSASPATPAAPAAPKGPPEPCKHAGPRGEYGRGSRWRRCAACKAVWVPEHSRWYPDGEEPIEPDAPPAPAAAAPAAPDDDAPPAF